jgi:hypothetical protein
LLAHSLAHTLITEVAMDCGYPASSIGEGALHFPGNWHCAPAVGILTYTASAGNQGVWGRSTGRLPKTQRGNVDEPVNGR